MPPKRALNSGTSTAQRLPMLPLKDAVVFPHMVVPLLVGRPASLAAVEESVTTEQPLFLCTQQDPSAEEPREKDLYRIGVAANVLQTLRMPDGTLKVVVEGLGRARVERFFLKGPVAEAVVRQVLSSAEDEAQVRGLMRLALSQFTEYARHSQRVAPEILMAVENMDNPDLLADTICAYLSLRVDERQQLLEMLHVDLRLERLASLLMRENELMEIERAVRERVREQMERNQRDHYLHEQLKVIHQELGNREEAGDEFSEIRSLIAKAKMPPDVKVKAEKEYGRYERMPLMSPEASVIRTYLEWLCEMPWSKRTKDSIDLKEAMRILNEDHHGLEKVKERILEFLAVRKLSKGIKGPILCLVGPPGVGKTSLGASIARAMKRKFVRVSLGGVRDEAEVRGHRRTYIGALPGRIIQSLKKVGVRNPVFLLDEVDKMSMDFRGDPSSALLEVLDPQQNKNFSDHYLEVEFDLSEVFFIATANDESEIPHPLHDRMEVVRLPGYTLHEKEKIATGFLIPQQVKATGLKKKHLTLTPAALDTIIQRYTREAGVRELERQIANICRKIARKVTEGADTRNEVDETAVFTMLGPPPYSSIRNETLPRVGVAVGLAWTQSGGDVLLIETTSMKGKGKLGLTGRLGEVMKESAEAAYTYIRAHAKELKVSEDFHKNCDLHVHVPEGAIPKDGPSAGVALMSSMLSALSGKTTAQPVAMTGEITLTGRVLPVGGIKEKVLAAHRAGFRLLVIPRENEKDLTEIPQDIRQEITFVLVDEVKDALKTIFG